MNPPPLPPPAKVKMIPTIEPSTMMKSNLAVCVWGHHHQTSQKKIYISTQTWTQQRTFTVRQRGEKTH